MKINMSELKNKAKDVLNVVKAKAGDAAEAVTEWLSDEDNLQKVYVAEMAFTLGAILQARKIYKNSLVVTTNELGQPVGSYLGKKGPEIAKSLNRAYSDGWSFLSGSDPEKLK